MAEEKEKKEKKEQEAPESQTVAPEGEARQPKQEGAGRQLRLNLQGVEPQYANFCTVALGQDEVFFNFAKVFGLGEEVKVDSQIFMSVRNAKRLSMILQRLIEQYESKAGILDVRM
jgi:hypothetical protein